MEKIYSQPSSGKQTDEFEPKEATVNFLLNYSKAFKCYTYKAMEFETILN
ncbi:hypothetical protein OD90_0623 [Dokdonia sp. Hel_I_53]|nr:hypothetical protein OD90_0623 [Dokdonia sp. Hel_I_53]